MEYFHTDKPGYGDVIMRSHHYGVGVYYID